MSLTADTGMYYPQRQATANNVGSLNGSFYTDPTTSKPTWSTYAPNNA